MMIMTALTELSAYFTGSAPSLLFAATIGAGLCGAYLFQLWRTTKAIASQQRIPVSLGLQRLASNPGYRLLLPADAINGRLPSDSRAECVLRH
jgi:hypothetical protein